MKGSEQFKKAIEDFLAEEEIRDPLFATHLAKESKNIDDCITYILNTVKATGAVGFDDSEIYSMAIHYYMEDDVKVGGKLVNTQIVVNHQVQLTEEELAEARKEAKEKAVAQALTEMKNIKKPKARPIEPKKEDEVGQGCLF